MPFLDASCERLEPADHRPGHPWSLAARHRPGTVIAGDLDRVRAACHHGPMIQPSADPDRPVVAAPLIRQVVFDAPDARRLAEFYRQLFGLHYRPGDEPPPLGEADPNGADWLVLRAADGGPGLAFQQVPDLPAPTWPDGPRPQMLHLDTTVPTVQDLRAQRQRALDLGASELLDRSQDEQEPLFVLADPAGHPFCIFVA